MSTHNGKWILASDSGLHNMYFGQLPEGADPESYLQSMAQSTTAPVPVVLYNARLILHQTVPLVSAGGAINLQTIFKVMPFPTNPDGAHIVLKATTLIDVEGDELTKELLMGQLEECRSMERDEKSRRSKLSLPPGILTKS